MNVTARKIRSNARSAFLIMLILSALDVVKPCVDK